MAKDSILVTVTAEDIANGKPKNINVCAVALALRRATGCDKAWIGRISLSVDGSDNRSEDTPPEVDAWILRFDRGEPVEPFSFTVQSRH